MTQKQAQSSIVLVHGLIGHLNDPVILEAFGDRNVHAPHLIGYGDAVLDPGTIWTLQDQADHVAAYIQKNELGPAHLVGHSVGGAVSVLTAQAFPECVASLTSVEGNFTLKDAFWSAGLSKKSDEEVEKIIGEFRADPDAWIAAAGVPINEWTSKLARSWLEIQPSRTIKRQARAVVEATQTPTYLDAVRALMESDLQFNLLAGERSAQDWDVPSWARLLASNDIEIPKNGHLMMAEDPRLFADSVLRGLRDIS